MLVNSDASQVKKETRSRQRISTSCTECKRRKQKCNQAKDRPCNNCSRRYPPVPCVYEALRKPPSKESGVGGSNQEIAKSEEAVFTGTHHDSKTSTLINLAHTQPYLPPRSPLAPGWGTFRPTIPNLLRSSSSQDSEVEDVPDATSKDISPSIREKRYYSYPEHHKGAYEGSSQIYVGGVALQPLLTLPIEASPRNSELFHFFIQRLSPYMSSIDGQDAPEAFTSKWLPFMTHAPIHLYITILTAAYFQATSRQIDFHRAVDVISTKMKIISLINEHIASNSQGVTDGSIAAVMSLAFNELIYTDEKSTLSHMRGLQTMVRSRGGLWKIEFDMLRKMLIRSDFQVACTFECPLFLYHDSSPIPTFTTYSITMDSPVVLSPHQFIASAQTLALSPAAAGILDDMRFLTTSILSFSDTPTPQLANPEERLSKFLVTVRWIHERLISTSPSLKCPKDEAPPDAIYATLHTTALIYTGAILHRRQLSQSCTQELLSTLWATMWRVPLPRWKSIPGIFFFILLVANPIARDKPEGRFLKGLMPACVMGMGVRDWDLVMGMLRGFLKVQEWLRGGGKSDERDLVSVNQVSKMPVGGLPSWSLSEG